MSNPTPRAVDLRVDIRFSKQILSDIEKAAHLEGMTMSELFKLADVNISNWRRWKSRETSPQLKNIEKLWSAILSKKLQNVYYPTGLNKLDALLTAESPS